jgi:hypothetical protein
VTVYHRSNKKVPTYTHFDVSPFKKVFSPDRLQAVAVKDAIIDPHHTIKPHKDPFDKDPGYSELKKRNTRAHDLKSKVIHDMMGRTIIKVDDYYGHLNGGLLC